jgi:hypothetical protein
MAQNAFNSAVNFAIFADGRTKITYADGSEKIFFTNDLAKVANKPAAFVKAQQSYQEDISVPFPKDGQGNPEGRNIQGNMSSNIHGNELGQNFYGQNSTNS